MHGHGFRPKIESLPHRTLTNEEDRYGPAAARPGKSVSGIRRYPSTSTKRSLPIGAGRNALYQLAALTIGIRLAVADA
jgi:hypothetical protein